MDIKAEDIMIQINDSGEGKCVVDLLPMNFRRGLSIHTAYIPDEKRDSLIDNIEQALRIILQTYSDHYQQLYTEIFNGAHAIPYSVLGGRDISDYVHEQIIKGLYLAFETAINNLVGIINACLVTD